MSTCYQVLGLTQPVSMADLKNAYRRAAAKYHPDRGGTHEEMIAVNDAYEQARWEVERNSQKTEAPPPNPAAFWHQAIDKLIRQQVQNNYKKYWVVHEILKSPQPPPPEVWQYLGERLNYHPEWYKHQADKWQSPQQTKDDPTCPEHPHAAAVVVPSGNLHAAALRCEECNRHLKWLGKNDYRVKSN
jgi:hypothetical protein